MRNIHLARNYARALYVVAEEAGGPGNENAFVRCICHGCLQALTA